MVTTKTNDSLIPAVSYVRMSGDKQEDSPEQQRAEIAKLAERGGYRLIHEYFDPAVSGDATEKRAAFLEMREAAASGTFQVILAWDTSRFGRFDIIDAGHWIRPFKLAGVSLVTVAEGPCDWENLTGQLLYSVQQMGKHAFLRDLSRNITRGQLAGAARGEWQGGPAPYGYQLQPMPDAPVRKNGTRPTCLVADPATAPVANRLIADLMQLNVLASINQRVEIELANRIASKYGYTVELERARRSTERKPVLRRDDADDDIPDDVTDDLVTRPPVVTFLGHVDHGKTSLMDRIRNATVAAGESGGITQHIGAYTVDVNGRKITFLDTPGHAAFSAMRARGASLTDIAVIIIAGDDGIMPQTKEAIRHAKQAGVQILVAINKCDLPQAKPERVKQQLQGEGLTPEDWGGDVVCCEVSAVTGKGVDHLLEMILLQADVLELTANISRRANGYVIEAQMEQGRGPTATLLVSGGTLNVGDVVLCGDYFGRIRALMDDRGRMVKSATPATAVKCMGLSGVPEAGSPFRVMLNEKRARDLAEKFAEERKRGELATSKVTSLDALMSQIKDQSRLELNIIVKADTQGSVEAIVDSLKEIKSEKVVLSIISSHIGNVTANDVQRANAGHALIIGFHVACEAGVQSMARHDGVRVQTFRIIYELLDRVKQEMLDLLAPEYREVLRGHAMVKTVFDLSRKGKIAGCQVSDGSIRTDAKVRVYRQRDVVYTGRIATLRHFQSEVTEVKDPQECGVRFENFDSFAEGDYIECYQLEELPRTL